MSLKKTDIAKLTKKTKKSVKLTANKTGTIYLRAKIGKKWFAKKIIIIYKVNLSQLAKQVGNLKINQQIQGFDFNCPCIYNVSSSDMSMTVQASGIQKINLPPGRYYIVPLYIGVDKMEFDGVYVQVKAGYTQTATIKIYPINK